MDQTPSREGKKPKPWKKIGKPKILAQSRERGLYIQKYEDPYTGEVEKFTLFSSVGLASIVFAVTTEKRVLIVRQYRHANDYISLELPGGSSKYPGQSPEEVAREELAEETNGYEPETVVSLMPNSFLTEALLAYPMHPFLFLDCQKTNHQAKPDKNEYIELVTFPIEEWINICQTGQIRDVRSVAITSLAKRYLNSIGWKI